MHWCLCEPDLQWTHFHKRYMTCLYFASNTTIWQWLHVSALINMSFSRSVALNADYEVSLPSSIALHLLRIFNRFYVYKKDDVPLERLNVHFVRAGFIKEQWERDAQSFSTVPTFHPFSFYNTFKQEKYITTMTQNMEVDFDVPKFLYEERQKTPSQLKHYYTTFEDLYERK